MHESNATPRLKAGDSFLRLKASDLIIKDDIKFLQEHSKQFEKRFTTRSIFRSKTEMEACVLSENEHPTPDSKYWQAIGEQNVHITELISLDFESKKLLADNELISAEIEELEDSIENESNMFVKKKNIARLNKKKIEYEQNKFNLMQQTKVAKERMREIRDWEGIITDLEPQLKYGTEDFNLHHPERYFLRYKRRMDMLEACSPEDKEHVISNFRSFADYGVKLGIQIEKSQLEKKVLNNNIPPGLPDNTSKEVEYDSIEELKKDDPIAANYFDRKVRKILVAAPHRFKEDQNVTNFFMMQTPAAYTCNISEPYGYTVPDAQNYIVQKAIDEGYEYIFFVEDDNLIPRNALVQLLHQNADIVGGIYYRKYLPLETAGMHLDKEGFPCSIEYTIGDVIHNTLVLPSGCTLIKVETLKKIEFPWYKTVGVAGRPAITSDTYLCQKMRDLGVDIVTDTGVQCLHIDREKGIIYGHPDIVDFEKNTVREEWRDYFAK